MPDVEHDSVHARLQRARIEANLGSARQAAKKLGVPISTYTSYENGSRAISVKVANELAAGLGVSATWLLTGDDSSPLYTPWTKEVPFKFVRVSGVVGKRGLVRSPLMQDASLKYAPAFVDPDFGDHKVHAWELGNDSIDREMPNVLTIFGIMIDDLGRDPRDGEIVLLEQKLNDSRFEWPVRVCRHYDSGVVYEPSSNNPDHHNITLVDPSEPYLVTRPLAVIVGGFTKCDVQP